MLSDNLPYIKFPCFKNCAKYQAKISDSKVLMDPFQDDLTSELLK